jgi:hypothetical protein
VLNILDLPEVLAVCGKLANLHNLIANCCGLSWKRAGLG